MEKNSGDEVYDAVMRDNEIIFGNFRSSGKIMIEAGAKMIQMVRGIQAFSDVEVEDAKENTLHVLHSTLMFELENNAKRINSAELATVRLIEDIQKGNDEELSSKLRKTFAHVILHQNGSINEDHQESKIDLEEELGQFLPIFQQMSSLQTKMDNLVQRTETVLSELKTMMEAEMEADYEVAVEGA